MLYVALLVLAELILFATNFKPGTYLMGWDNLMPEFNIGLNLKRSLFGLWQEYRGLGLVDGLSHTSNLLHTLYIALLRIALPQSMVRYVFIFGTHLVGGIAFFYLMQYLLGLRVKGQGESPKPSPLNALPSFIGALFYMFNIGVVQMYFAPLEVFAVHFATLPLLTLFMLKVFEKPTRKNYLAFCIVAFLTTPATFVPTLFLVFLVLFLSLLFFNSFKKELLKTSLVILLLFIAVNAFWLFPYVYSVEYNTSVIPNTKINQFSSEEIFYRNQAFGDVLSVLNLRGFMMDTIEYDHINGVNIYFLNTWREYTKTLFYQIPYLLFFISSFVGLFVVIKKRRVEFFPFIISGAVSFFFLANNTPVLKQLNDLIRTTFPVIGEAFRFPFTKFILLFAFSLSIFSAYGIAIILARLKKYKFIAAAVFFIAIIAISAPSYSGQFVSPLLKVKLPQDYLNLMSYLDKQDENQRIALLPAYTFWNWQYRRFGQRGSGFLWYGIKQPILDRPFDPWSTYNEQFYNELSYAINSQQTEALKRVLTKYNVSYLLVDQYIINSLSTKPIDYGKLARFLDKAPFIKKEQIFGKIILYKNSQASSWVSTQPKNTPTVLSSTLYTQEDKIYKNLGTYVNVPTYENTIFPFASLYSGKLQKDLQFKAQEYPGSIKISPKISLPIKGNFMLKIPNQFAQEGLIPVEISVQPGKLILLPISPKFIVNNTTYEYHYQPIEIALSKVLQPDKIVITDNRQELKPGQKTYIRNNYLNSFKVTSGKQEELVMLDTRIYPKTTADESFSLSDIKSIVVETPKITSPYSYKNLIQKNGFHIYTSLKEITAFREKRSYVLTNKTADAISFEARGDSAEVALWRPTLPHEAGYIAFIKADYSSGLPMTFYIDNPYEKRAELETRLSKITEDNVAIIEPSEKYFQGYGFHLITKSVGDEIGKDQIKEFSEYPFPVNTLLTLSLEKDSAIPLMSLVKSSPITFKKGNPSAYEVQNLPKDANYLILSQAYQPGWKAYANGKELKNHVLVNNWANAWLLDNLTIQQFNNSPKITIIFWPQYLEFIGFGVFVISLVGIIAFLKKPKKL